MRWIAISGSWRITNQKVDNDVRREIRKILKQGNGIITGGALGVDYIATDEVLKHDPQAKKIIIFLPATLNIFRQRYYQRAKEGVITLKQAETITTQLKKIKKINPKAIKENLKNKTINKKVYYQRNSEVIKASDALIAFQVNESQGTQDTINKAIKKGLPIKKFSYTI